MQLIRFTRAYPPNTPLFVNPDAVAAVTIANDHTIIYLMGTGSEGNALAYAVTDDIEYVAAALTKPEE